jgi:hypothetical protein
MSRFQRSWRLFKSSLFIIARNKQLLVFPIIIFFLTMMIILFFLAPAVLRPTGYSYASAQHWTAIGHSLFTQSPDAATGNNSRVGLTPGAMVYLAFLYFVSMFFATFFNVAFYHEILAALGGQPVSIVRGLKFAGTKWKAVLMWALFAGLVGLIIRQLEQRLSFLGRIIARFIGIAWSIAAVFVIPIIVCEEQNANPVAMLKKSAGILKRTWGEALIGYVGLGMVSGLMLIVSMVFLFGALVGSIMLNNYWLLAIAGVLWLVAMFALSYLTSLAGQIYKGALYLYASSGVVPEPYSQEMLDSAWKFKKS